MNAQELIAQERQRQIEVEGWTPAHDDAHGSTDLACAAACYMLAFDDSAEIPQMWPLDVKWWKPKDRQRNLVRAGALYLAAADAAERAKDFKGRNVMRQAAESCSILLQSILAK